MKTVEEYIAKAEKSLTYRSEKKDAEVYAMLARAVAALRQAKALEELVELVKSNGKV